MQLPELRKQKAELEIKIQSALKNNLRTNYVCLKSRLDSVNLHIQAQTQKQKNVPLEEYSIPRLSN
jgi:hypothetical protein